MAVISAVSLSCYQPFRMLAPLTYFFSFTLLAYRKSYVFFKLSNNRLKGFFTITLYAKCSNKKLSFYITQLWVYVLVPCTTPPGFVNGTDLTWVVAALKQLSCTQQQTIWWSRRNNLWYIFRSNIFRPLKIVTLSSMHFLWGTQIKVFIWNCRLAATIPLKRGNLRSHGTLRLVPTCWEAALDCFFS
jgi:hypothetical protein